MTDGVSAAVDSRLRGNDGGACCAGMTDGVSAAVDSRLRGNDGECARE